MHAARGVAVNDTVCLAGVTASAAARTRRPRCSAPLLKGWGVGQSMDTDRDSHLWRSRASPNPSGWLQCRADDSLSDDRQGTWVCALLLNLWTMWGPRHIGKPSAPLRLESSAVIDQIVFGLIWLLR